MLASAVAASAGVAVPAPESEVSPQPAMMAAAVSAASVAIVQAVRAWRTVGNIDRISMRRPFSACCEEAARYPNQMALF